jgi:hypothetical protein
VDRSMDVEDKGNQKQEQQDPVRHGAFAKEDPLPALDVRSASWHSRYFGGVSARIKCRGARSENRTT